MGKRARAQRHIKKMAAKRALRAQRKAYYESLRGTGANKKKRAQRKRSGSNQAVQLERMKMIVAVGILGALSLQEQRVHAGPKCRNIGCHRCSELWQSLTDKLKRKSG